MFSQPVSSNFPATAARSRLRVFALSSALVLTCGPAFAQDSGLTAFNAYVEALKGLGLDVQNGAVNYDATTDTLTVTDSSLSLRGTVSGLAPEKPDVAAGKDAGPGDTEPPKPTSIGYSFSFSAGKMTITGLTHEGNSFSVESWQYSDDTSFAFEGEAKGKGRLKVDGRMTGISASNYSFVVPVMPAEDPSRQASRWLPFLKAALLASADDISIASTGMTIEAFSLEDGKETKIISGTSEIDGYNLTGMVNGSIAEYTMDSFTQDLKTLQPETGQMLDQSTRQGKTVYSDINVSALIDLFDSSVPETGEKKTLIGSGSAIDYESRQEVGPGLSVKMTAEKASIDEVTAIKRDNNLLTMFDSFLDKKVTEPVDIVGNVLQFYRSFAIKDARISGFAVNVPTPGSAPDIDVDIKEMALTDFSSDGIGEMLLVGLNVPHLPDGGSFKLDWGALGDIEFAAFPPMKETIAKLLADPNYGENNPLEVARAFLPYSLSYELDGLVADLPDVGRTEIGKAEFDIATTVPPVPTSLFIKNDGVKLPVSTIEAPEAKALFKALGLETVNWSDETRLYWDEATLELRLERLMLNIEGLGKAEASARFSNVPKVLFEDPQGQGQVAAIMAQFVDASLTFQDAGLASKGLTHFAEAQGIPEDVFRAALVAQAIEMTAPIGNESFTSMVKEAATKFLDNPGELKITLAPANPVPLAQILGSMAAPQTLPDLLNVSVVAN